MISKRRKEALHANKIILAPMVRVGTLPMRLLALRHGADLVYTEEIIDFKLINSRRLVNNELNTVDFVDDSGVVVFRTSTEERNKVILQIGTNDPKRALLAAQMVEEDVAGIDVNMGCPKSFSLKGGMGAALLEKPDLITKILTTLKDNISKPVTCKIRVLKDLDATLKLAKLIEQTGVDALAVHGRTKEERPQHPNRDEYVRAIADTLQIPVIANGGSSSIDCYQDIVQYRNRTNASSIMIARTAMKNCSVFDKSGKMAATEDLIRSYLRLAIQYDNNAINTKYCIQQMLGALQDTPKGKLLLGAYDLETMAQIYELTDFFEHMLNQRKRARDEAPVSPRSLMVVNMHQHLNGNSTVEQDHNLIQLPVIFNKNIFTHENLPKSVLNRWITKHNHEKPSLRTYQVEKHFHCVLQFAGKSYCTPYLQKTKRHAEQSATLVFLFALGLCNDPIVQEKCLLSDASTSSIDALKYEENNRTYLIRINK